MPLALLNTAAIATPGRRFGAGPIHHTPQTARFRYSPLAAAPATAPSAATSQDLLASQILQMAAVTGKKACIIDYF